MAHEPTKARSAVNGLRAMDSKAVPLVHGSEVTTVAVVVDSAGGRTIPQGTVGRVTQLHAGGSVTIAMPGRGTLEVARELVAPRNEGQARHAVNRQAVERALRPCVVYEATVGSRAWGLADASSDHDTRGVVLWPFSWATARGRVPDVFTSADGSHTYWEFGRTIDQALRADPNTLEALFVDDVDTPDETGAWLREARQAFVSQQIYGSFGRYALSQSNKLAKSLRLAEHRALVLQWLAADATLSLDKVAARLADEALDDPSAGGQLRAKQYLKQQYGSLYDQGLLATRSFAGLAEFAQGPANELELPRELRPKNAYNLLRIVSCAVQWLETGEPLIETRGRLREQLLAIKEGAVELQTALRWTDDVADNLQRARAESVLPVDPDFAAADRLLLRVREAAATRWLDGSEGPWGRGATPLPRDTVTDDRYDR